MPPKKAVKNSAASLLPLHDCSIALSGTFPNLSQGALEKQFLTALGASMSKTINQDTTHLVTTEIDFNKPSAKVKQAQSLNLAIVNLSWLEDCLKDMKRLSEDGYAFDASPAPTANSSRKRSVGQVHDNNDDDGDQPNPKKSKAKSSNTQSQEASQPASINDKQSKVPKLEKSLKWVMLTL
jgi:poly [ADP-ribose] polymerase